eukprot:gb/GFBE01075121.1/.p1 GENE.gb/GFBE01075121.1/~~gb/GFBE01075121.1/.p1  ORF type:complete len:568 (+),score=86.62 gb/GFBE01075121.1/:1-1704(+)
MTVGRSWFLGFWTYCEPPDEVPVTDNNWNPPGNPADDEFLPVQLTHERAPLRSHGKLFGSEQGTWRYCCSQTPSATSDAASAQADAEVADVKQEVTVPVQRLKYDRIDALKSVGKFEQQQSLGSTTSELAALDTASPSELHADQGAEASVKPSSPKGSPRKRPSSEHQSTKPEEKPKPGVPPRSKPKTKADKTSQDRAAEPTSPAKPAAAKSIAKVRPAAMTTTNAASIDVAGEVLSTSTRQALEFSQPVQFQISRSATASSIESDTTTPGSSTTGKVQRRNRRTSTMNSQSSIQSSLPSVKEWECNFDRGSSCSSVASASEDDRPRRHSFRGGTASMSGVLRMFSRSNEPTAPENAVIIFDWDDTLCPTTWALDIIKKAKNEAELAKIEQAHAPELAEHVVAVEQLLRAARSVARVAIVTLATPDFWKRSAETFLDGLNVKDLFPELGIKVYYATRQPRSSDIKPETVAKKKAMAKCLGHLYPAVSARGVRWNVLSIGDSAIEQEALKQLLSDRSSSPLCKTLKFTTEPSLEQLTRQVQAVTPHLPEMVAHMKDFDRVSSRPWSSN